MAVWIIVCDTFILPLQANTVLFLHPYHVLYAFHIDALRPTNSMSLQMSQI